MRANKGSSRLDTLEIKSLINQKIGNQRAESYFHHLKRFFALMITKSVFDKLCINTIGRHNISLHNHLIRSIINNASVAKSPPSKYPKKGGNFVRLSNQIQTLYGDSAFSPSARKSRSRNRLSPLGPLGKPQSITTTSGALGSRPPASVEEGVEVEQIVQSRSPVTAPLGVSMNLRKSMSCSSFNVETCQSSGELPDTRTLRSWIERRLEMEGIKISMDSVSLLNSGLDTFMRRLIVPCLSLANTRCGNEQVREMNFKSAQQSRSHVLMSDFRAGMELHRQILEKWPILMEKICLSALE